MTILSPENKTYAMSTGIPLTFTVDETTGWIGYNLDGQANVTITGNATLPTLSDGPHYVFVYANDTVGNMGKITAYFTVDTVPPTAHAGSDQAVNEDVPITLDGSASTDNVDVTSYTWTFIDGTVKTLTGEKPVYTFKDPGVYTITLNVTDAAGNWATDTIVITVALDETEPVADAGEDQTVDAGATVSFDAGGSTDNVGIISYDWDFGDGSSGTGKTTSHDYTNAGTYTVTLTVRDAAGNQAANTMLVTVNSTGGFPWWILLVALLIAVVVIIVVLVFWKRRKETTEPTR
jgi:PKD repeat protein